MLEATKQIYFKIKYEKNISNYIHSYFNGYVFRIVFENNIEEIIATRIVSNIIPRFKNKLLFNYEYMDF